MLISLLSIAGLLPLLAAAAPVHPNFSGLWKLALEKSAFGPLPAPASRTDRIEHRDPALRLDITQSGAQGDLSYTIEYTTDGAENSNKIGSNPMKSTLHWEGDNLIVETKARFRGVGVQIRDRWTLGEGGKTIVIERHLTSVMGNTDQKFVFEQQD